MEDVPRWNVQSLDAGEEAEDLVEGEVTSEPNRTTRLDEGVGPDDLRCSLTARRCLDEVDDVVFGGEVTKEGGEIDRLEPNRRVLWSDRVHLMERELGMTLL